MTNTRHAQQGLQAPRFWETIGLLWHSGIPGLAQHPLSWAQCWQTWAGLLCLSSCCPSWLEAAQTEGEGSCPAWTATDGSGGDAGGMDTGKQRMVTAAGA